MYLEIKTRADLCVATSTVRWSIEISSALDMQTAKGAIMYLQRMEELSLKVATGYNRRLSASLGASCGNETEPDRGIQTGFSLCTETK